MPDFQETEKKWREAWEKDKIFEVKENDKPKYYVLEMFPYPSGAGLHVGHALNYTIGDVLARYKIMSGFNVLHPMGFDSLGLPAENAAIKEGQHPRDYTENSIANYIKQAKVLGITYDWTRMVKTSDPNYYKWDQWIFIEMFKKGLAYKKKSPVNWCPKCNTVLANEQVHNGKCWRHEDTDVEVKNLSQWFLKTTQYAEELNNFDKLDGWPETIKRLQRNWIGKSFGTEVNFEINGEDWHVFTTRPDTLYGVTFLVISAQHPRLDELVTKDNKEKVANFVKKLHSVSQEEIEQLDKEGIFTGSYATHPLTKEKVPIYAGNFVVADYGSGMVMAVPCHDQRDFEFAKKYDIPLKVVINPTSYDLNADKMSRAYTDDGVLINSDKFNGYGNRDAIIEITKELEKIGKGKKTVNYRLRDWLISRQRYWGTPIPIIECPKCGEVPETNLPVELPYDVKFGEGNPLETNEEFINTTCPKCKGRAKRVTDTMDTFVNSSWYFLRYTDAHNDKAIFEKEKANYWAPVDFYIGGKEHACMHLIYVRFYTKFLRDIGLLNMDEPSIRLFNQGMVHGSDGNKMSKSLGNVVDPLDVSKKYGVDVLRFYLMSNGAPDSDSVWSTQGVEGIARFMKKVRIYFDTVKEGKTSPRVQSKLHQTIKHVTEHIETFQYNQVIVRLRELFEVIEDTMNKEDQEILLKLLTPFTPHLAEEYWHRLGNDTYISLAKWPKHDEAKIDEEFDLRDSIIASTIADIRAIMGIRKLDKAEHITLIISPRWKYAFYETIKELLQKTHNPKDIIPKVMAKAELKEHSKDIMKMLPKIIKTGALPDYLSHEKEDELFIQAVAAIKEEFGAKVVIAAADSSDEPKASNASPGKPAIIVK